AGVLVGCGGITYPEKLQCPDGVCPSGQTCGSDGVCRKPDSLPTGGAGTTGKNDGGPKNDGAAGTGTDGSNLDTPITNAAAPTDARVTEGGGCKPTTCAAEGKNCGTILDGCGK